MNELFRAASIMIEVREGMRCRMLGELLLYQAVDRSSLGVVVSETCGTGSVRRGRKQNV
jgi:hypothetical protein